MLDANERGGLFEMATEIDFSTGILGVSQKGRMLRVSVSLFRTNLQCRLSRDIWGRFCEKER